jgi:hypothetical protein
MTVAYEAGYALPGGDLPLNHARIVHSGVSFAPTTITASAEVTGYPGAAANIGDTVDRWRPVASGVTTATLDYTLAAAQEADCFAIAAHNLGTIGGTIGFYHDSNGDGTWTLIGSVNPTDDSPILFFFDPITSDEWRIQVSVGAVPEIGVFRIAKALQMQRPFYSGYTPARMNRAVDLNGNISGSGELLGRSVKRSVLNASYSWDRITYAWVRANLDGPTGLIQSLETDAAFVAWKPSTEQDVDYVMRARVQPPAAMGMVDLWSFAMGGEAYSYE